MSSALRIAWLVSMIVAGSLGYWLGTQHSTSTEPSKLLNSTNPGTTEPTALTPAHNPTAPADSQDSPTRLSQINQLVRTGKSAQAISLARDTLFDTPHDMTVRFILAAQLAAAGRFDEAISEYLAIRAATLDTGEFGRARRLIDAIVEQRNAHFLAQAATDEAIRFFENLVVKEPSYDRHRLFLARWLLRAQRLDAAQRLAKEIGLVGVSSDELASLHAELTRRSASIDIERSDDALFTQGLVSTIHATRELRFLVDTGATISGLAMHRLRELGARRLQQQATVHTAGGVVSMPIYILDSLEVGSLQTNELRVLGLDTLPPGVDGLLGLDILDQLPNTDFTPDS